MGLDVCVFEFVKIPDNVNTEKELNEFCEKNGDLSWETLEDDIPNDKKIPREYVKRIPIELDDLEATFAKLGLDFKDYAWVQTGYDTVSFVYVKDGIPDYEAPESTYLNIKMDDIVKKTEEHDVIVIGNEVGYQRKGANKQFYDDGKWDIDTWVFTKEELIEHWNKYFSDPNDSYYGKEARKHFKKNIIDNFEEGRTFVMYC